MFITQNTLNCFNQNRIILKWNYFQIFIRNYNTQNMTAHFPGSALQKNKKESYTSFMSPNVLSIYSLIVRFIFLSVSFVIVERYLCLLIKFRNSTFDIVNCNDSCQCRRNIHINQSDVIVTNILTNNMPSLIHNEQSRVIVTFKLTNHMLS